MQSKTTLKRIGGLLQKSLMILGLFCFFVGKINAQIFTNGNLSTGATASTGDPAPAGYTWSEVQAGNGNAGYSANITNGFTVADDFNVTCGTWDITKFTCYSYSTGYAGATSPVVDLRVQIFDTDPSVGTPTPIFGNLTTNVLTASTDALMYRIFNATPGTTRKIWKNEFTFTTPLSLPIGHYWVEWQVDVAPGLTSNFSPASTVIGTTTQAGNNALQHDIGGAAWTPILDGPGGADAQDMPFRLDYNTTVCTGTPAPGNTVSSDATVCPGNSFTLSPQNPTCGSGVTYQWQSSVDGINFTNIPGATNATYSTTQTAPTYYQVIVSCSGTPGPVSPVLVDLSPSNQCYCIPASSVCTDGDIITNVTLNTLNNTSDCEVDGFINYGADPTVTIPDIVQGIGNPIAVTAGGGLYDEYVGVWIDFDHSGTFDASEFTDLGTTTGGTLTAPINVPASAPLGQARMRVRVQFFNPFTAGDACTGAFLGFGETEDYFVNIIPCVQGVFNVQPVNTSVVCGNNVSFSTSVSGTYIAYQWQEKVGSGPWTNVVNGGQYGGATTSTLNLSSVTGSWDGNLYRVLISGGCTAIDFSDIVTLTVTPLVINVDPVSYSTCSPIPTTAPVPLTITTVAGGSVSTTTSYYSGVINLAVPDLGDPTGVTTSVTVPPLPAGAVVTGASVTFNANHTYAGDLIIALKAPNGNTLSLDYGIGATGGPGATTVGFVNTEISSDGVTALVDGAEPWTGLWAADAFPDPGPGFFPVAPTSLTSGPIVTTWGDLYSVPDGTWTLGVYDYATPDAGTLVDWTFKLTYTVTSTAPFAGVWTPSAGLFLDAAGATAYDGSVQTTVYAAPSSTTVYTVTVTNAICPAAPVEVPVTILSADPTLTVTALPYTKIFPGLRTMLTAKVVPASASTNTFQWYHNGDTIPGANASTLEVGFGAYGLGTYTVDLIDPTICSGRLSESIEITDSTSNTLFIWPNPNHGIFQVRYNDGINDIISQAPYLGVYDSKGARLSDNSYKIVRAYDRMDVDMSKMPNGVYIVVLYDGSGKLIQTGRVVIR